MPRPRDARPRAKAKVALNLRVDESAHVVAVRAAALADLPVGTFCARQFEAWAAGWRAKNNGGSFAVAAHAVAAEAIAKASRRGSRAGRGEEALPRLVLTLADLALWADGIREDLVSGANSEAVAIAACIKLELERIAAAVVGVRPPPARTARGDASC